MKRYILTSLLLVTSLFCMAVPALRQKRVIRLSDGTSVEATLRGDEHLHYYQDTEGRVYQMGEMGLYEQANLLAVQQRSVQRMQKAAIRRQSRLNGRRDIPGVSGKHYSGVKKCLVVLAEFSDNNMIYTSKEFDHFFNEKGYTDNGMKGSVRDYFLACSYGELDVQFDVVGPVKLQKSVTYYGANDSRGDDRHPGKMVSEAIIAAEELGTDFSKYDWDCDGEVDQVLVIYAGYGEAQSGIETNIWPHESTLSETGSYGDGPGALTFDGVKIDTYATTCELQGRRGDELDGIGTACHEFSHCMGLPDTYDALQTGNFAMDVWDVMDYGCYNGVNGKMSTCPWEFTSYERMCCGWLKPRLLKEGCEVNDMMPLDQSPEAYLIYNDGNQNEYYLLENRQLEGFDAGGYGHGMLVIHIDYDKTAWDMNMLNTNAKRQRMTIIPADGSYRSLADGVMYVAGDPFPGTKNKTSLTDNTLPSASLYNDNTDGTKFMHKPITGIRENTDTHTISFIFMGGALDAFQHVDASPHVDRRSSYYDFQGRHVAAPHRGVYIRDGKKIVK